MKTEKVNGSKAAHFKTANCYGVVLAGGRSMRMGTDKTMLLFKGRTLLDRATSLLSMTSLPLKQIYISGGEGPNRRVPDPILYQGPLCGVVATIDAIEQQDHLPVFLLAIPVDMPCLHPSLFDRLLQNAMKSEVADVVLFEQHFLPLVIRVTEQVKASFMSALNAKEQADRSFRNVTRHLHVQSLTLSQEEQVLFSNVNTPEQWEKYIQERG